MSSAESSAAPSNAQARKSQILREKLANNADLDSLVNLISTPWQDSILGAFSFGYDESLRAPRLITAHSYVADTLKFSSSSRSSSRALHSDSSLKPLRSNSSPKSSSCSEVDDDGLDYIFLEQKSQACRNAMMKLSEVGVPASVLLPTREDKVDEFVAVALRYLLPHRRGESAKVATLIDEMIARYFNVAYHHVGHAALVCHNAVEIARLVGLWRLMSSDEKITFSLIGLGHDMGHPGKNVKFLRSIGHPLTKLYNDVSPLENYHAASLLQLLERPDCNVLSKVCASTRASLRRLLIQGILWTDLTEHSTYLASARARLSEVCKGEGSRSFLDDDHFRRAALGMCIKASDLAYMCLEPPVIMLQWAMDFYTEVFAQSVLEEELGCFDSSSIRLSHLGTSSWFLQNSQFIESVVLPIGIYLGELECLLKDPKKSGLEDDGGAWCGDRLTLAFPQVALVRALDSQDLESLASRLAEAEACGLDAPKSLAATPTFKRGLSSKTKSWWQKPFSPPALTSQPKGRKTNAWRALVEPAKRNAEALRRVRYLVDNS